MLGRVTYIVQESIVRLILAYRLILSPFLGHHCRFAPSCSSYACVAIRRFGILKGGYLSLHRLLRCHPFVEGGYDPVPVDES